MIKKKILVVTGTRAEYGLLRSTMDAIRAHRRLELRLLVTGMHTLRTYGKTQEEIKKDGYRIDCIVPIKEGSDMLNALSQEIIGIQKYWGKERPDCVLVLGDRDEPFAAAIVAAHLNIPLAHIHGGDTTGPGVDESIRHSITKFAHIHFPGTKKSAERIQALGEDPDRIFEVGTVVLDIFQKEELFERAQIASEIGLDPMRAWITMLQHPSAFDKTPLKQQIRETIHALEEFSDCEKIVLYPNNDTGTEIFIKAINGLKGERYHVVQSLPRQQFMSLVKESVALIGNSSAGIIETSFLGTPTVDIGQREKGRERGESVTNVGYSSAQIVTAIQNARRLKKERAGKPFLSPYGNPGAGIRIADILSHELQNPNLLNKRHVV